MDLLTLIIIVLVIVVSARIIRVLELSQQLSGHPVEEITEKDNKTQGGLMLVVLILGMIFIAYTTYRYGKLTLPAPASSEHGVSIDRLMNLNYVIIFTVFFVTTTLLFYFAYKYSHRKERKASYISDNHRLEIIWTVIPSIVLLGIIGYGLTVWTRITSADTTGAKIVEVYGQQFKWTARYAGADNTLGFANFKKINVSNPLGVDSTDDKAKDDVLTNDLHLKLNEPTLLIFRSQDVIHSAYLPHFRVQMNCVPGMLTQFFFKPTITTADMRTKLNDSTFDYVLLCNKICGVSHFTMKMKVIVDDESAYDAWMSKQKTFAQTNSAKLKESPAVKQEPTEIVSK